MDYADAIYKAGVNNRRLNSVINEFEFITEARITYLNTKLVNYMSLLYDRAIHNALQGYWHASPGLIAFLAGIWGILKIIYNSITYIIELLKIKEILEMAKILTYIWPAFRTKYNAILGKISEFSAQIGWGADGLIHLIQAAQGGMEVLRGVLGKSHEWLQIAGAEKGIEAIEWISAMAMDIAANPGNVLDLAFRIPRNATADDTSKWWAGVSKWIEDTSGTAVLAIQKVNDTIDNLQELENSLPNFIKNHIPQEIWDGINWVDAKIDDTILPALTNINQQFIAINEELQAERDRAQALAEQLLLPGNVLGNVDLLSGADKLNQELKIDDITSRIYEKETDRIYESDREVIEGLESVKALALLDLPELTFLSLETGGRPGIFYDPAEIADGWFVGDF